MKSFVPFILLLGSLLGSLGTAKAQTPTPPTMPDQLLHVVDSSCKWAKLGWTNGDGQYRALVLVDLTTNSQTNPNVAPTQGTRLFGSSFFGTGGYTSAGGYAVYTDRPAAATVRNLIKGHQYRAFLYPYNQNTAGQVAYQLTSPATLDFTTPDCPDVSPSKGASNLRATTIDCSTFKITCHPGNGQGRLFVMRKSSSATTGTSAGDVSIAQETYLFASNLYARGFETQFQSECYALASGSDSTVTVYGLAPNQIYKCAVYEFNTVPGPEGFPDGVTPYYQQLNYPIFFPATGSCTGSEPFKSMVDDTQHQTSRAVVTAGSLTPSSVSISWHPSITLAHYGPSGYVPAGQSADDGVGSYVVINNALSPTALPLPVQNTVPARLSTVYGQGSPVRPGQDSIYSVKLTTGWQDSTVSITGLRPRTTYTVNVFTYRYPDAGGVAPYTYFLSLPQAAVTFTTPAAPLPVSLVSFRASHEPGTSQVQLNWATASEVNNAGFGIERSRDGRTFTSLGFVTAGGAYSGADSYALHTYVSVSPYVGAAYYRLRQEDSDGKITYSPVSYVSGETQSAPLSVFPNPTTAAFTVLGADLTQPLEVYDLLGQRVLTLPAGVVEGTLGALPGGVYVLRQGGAYTRLVHR
jgi:hypothetical protein